MRGFEPLPMWWAFCIPNMNDIQFFIPLILGIIIGIVGTLEVLSIKEERRSPNRDKEISDSMIESLKDAARRSKDRALALLANGQKNAAANKFPR